MAEFPGSKQDAIIGESYKWHSELQPDISCAAFFWSEFSARRECCSVRRSITRRLVI